MRKPPPISACIAGGRARVRQHAQHRRDNPSQGEKCVRDHLTSLGVAFEVEYEILHENGRPQFIDIYIPEIKYGIEVDGSHGWHGYSGKDDYGKMAWYDELKTTRCNVLGITIYKINTSDRCQSDELEKLGDFIQWAIRDHQQTKPSCSEKP